MVKVKCLFSFYSFKKKFMYLNNVQSFVYSFFIFVAIAFMACEKTYETNKIVSFGEQVEVAQNDFMWFGSDTISGIKVFVNEISDSRCPTNVVCVWEGEAKVSFLANPKSDSVYVSLKFPSLTKSSQDTVSFIIKNQTYKAVLSDVYPYPKSNNAAVKQTAKITILKN